MLQYQAASDKEGHCGGGLNETDSSAEHQSWMKITLPKNPSNINERKCHSDKILTHLRIKCYKDDN